MAITTLYSTNDPACVGGPGTPNQFDCAVVLAVSDDRSEYCVSVVNNGSVLNRSAYAIFDRAELRLLRDAIDAELKATEN